MKKSRKMVALVLALSLLIGMMPGNVTEVHAASPNSQVTTAIDLSSGNIVTSAFTEDDEYLYYKYTAPSSGFVEFSLERNDYLSEDKGGWKLYVLSDKMNQYEESEDDTQVVSRRYTVQSGDTFYLKVDNYYAAYALFDVCAKFTSLDRVEKENNDTMQSATSLVKGKATVGGLSTSDDVDYYCFTAPSNGYVYFDFSRYQYVTSETYMWRWEIFDSKANILEDTQYYTGDDNSGYIVCKKGQKIYVKVYNSSNAYKELYCIKPTYVSLKNIETEPNNSFSGADKMNIGTTYYGALTYGSSEEDYFYFKAAATRKYKITISYKDTMKNGDDLYIYDANKNTVVYKTEIKKSGSVSFKAKKGKKYYIVVKHHSSFWGYTYNELYKLKVSKA